MRISAALDSLVHGITTRAKTIADPKFLRDQLNMRTDTSSGLRKRPPTTHIAANIAGTFDPDTDWVKQFVRRQITYFLVVKQAANPDAPAATDVQVIDQNGDSYQVEISPDAYKYIAQDTTREDVQLNVHGDTIYITAKTKITSMRNDKRASVKHSLIHVKTAPLSGEVITLQITGADGTQYPVGGSSITVSTAAGGNSVYAVASQLGALSIPGLTISSTGSVVQIVENSTNEAVIIQLSNTRDLIPISEEIETIEDLPRNAPVGKIVGVRTKGAPDSTVVYLRAELDAAGSASVAQANGKTTFTRGILPSGDPYLFGTTAGITQYAGYDIGTMLIGAGYFSPTGGDRLRIYIDKDHLLPAAQNIARVVFVDETDGTIAADIAMTRNDLTVGFITTVDRMEFVSTTVLDIDTVLDTGKTYKIYFNLVGSLSSGNPIDAVIWKETSAPNSPFKLDERTLPVVLEAQSVQNNFTLRPAPWEDRNAGNNENNPIPAFIGKTISGTAIFQNRLVLLSEDNIVTSETDNTASLFRNTVSQQLVTQPVRIRSTASDSSPFEHAINHNKDLMLVTDNAQYKLDGSVPLTPQSAGLPQVSSYSSKVEVKPVSLGNKVYHGISYGTSTGIAEFTSSSLKEIQEQANAITDLVKGFIPADVELITGDASTGNIVVASRTGNLYVCNFDTGTSRAEERRHAWSKWFGLRADDEYTIEAVHQTKTKLHIALAHGTQLDLVSLDISQDNVETEEIVYLDNQVTAVVDASHQLQIPTGYILHADTRVVHDYGQTTQGLREEYTVVGDKIQLDTSNADLIGKSMVFGTPFTATVTPQYILGRDQEGLVNTSTNIRVLRWNIFLNSSAAVTARVDTPYANIPDQFWSGLIAGDFSTMTDRTANTTAVFGVSFKQRGDVALLHITSDSHLPMNITEIEYIGNYISRGRRQ